MHSHIIAFIVLFFFSLTILAEDIILVVPRNIIGGINHGIKITPDNMAVRKFNKEDFPGEYLIEKDFAWATNQTVDRPIQAGQPIPMEAIVPLWVEYTSDKAGFKVMVPGETIIKEFDGKDEEWMPSSSKIYLVMQGDMGLKQGLHSYQILISDYPPENVPEPGRDNIIKKARDQNIEFMKEEGFSIKQMDENEISLSGYAGLEMNLIADDGDINIHVFQKTYQVGNRIYNLSVTSPTSRPAPELDRQRFFNSFKLIKP